MRRIMFFDIDGTLVPETGDAIVLESTVEALDRAKRAGHLLFVNTGRPAMNVAGELPGLPFDGFVMGCGTHIVCGEKELFYHTVRRELCLETANIIRECGAVPMFERRDRVSFDFTARSLPLIDGIREGFAAQGKDVSHSTEDPDFSFDKFIIAFDGLTDTARLRPELEKNFFWIERGGGFAEFVPKPYSKATGIEFVLRHYGLSKENAYAVGDSLNDLPMFSAVGTSIAMGNGKMLIPYADHVTDDIDRDGIYNALRRFGFFEEAQVCSTKTENG